MPIRVASCAGGVGEIAAHLFENAYTGVRRGLYWSVDLPCASVRWGDEDCETSLICEWLQWRVSDWTGIDGASLRSAVDSASVECSFDLAEHHPVVLSSIALKRINANRFLVGIAGAVTVSGFDELDGQSVFSIEGEADFTGLVLVPDNLFPKPSTEQEAADELAKFIDTSNLLPPQWDRFRYVFAPSAASNDA
jgi:hypothetical protein